VQAVLGSKVWSLESKRSKVAELRCSALSRGLDACSSLELEYAEALRAGGAEGWFLVPKVSRRNARKVSLRRGSKSGTFRGRRCEGSFGSRCRRFMEFKVLKALFGGPKC
jgi:hypothetical protein